ncbi:hypothetical protein ACHAWF_007843 [Thalassiosira exigua]
MSTVARAGGEAGKERDGAARHETRTVNGLGRSKQPTPMSPSSFQVALEHARPASRPKLGKALDAGVALLKLLTVIFWTVTELVYVMPSGLCACHLINTLTPPHFPLCQDLDVVYEDEHIVVVGKPSGVLTIPGKDASNPSLNQAVFDRFGSESGRMDKMVVHRLGMDTSGLVVFARTDAALRGMNSLFRSRKVTRKYEALVCGHVANDSGSIDLPLMRDYEHPPYMRVSTDDHQRALVDLDPSAVGKKMLEAPKPSVTTYAVANREDLDGNDVTRLTLTSVSGRTHQLNVHCAAIGHPIVGDVVYGAGGDAAPNGGLEEGELPGDKASAELQSAVAAGCAGKPMCVHAKSISFRHPITKEELSFESNASF